MTLTFGILHTLPQPQHWPSGYELKIGRLKVPGSIPDQACRPNRSEFSVVFSKTCVNTCQNTLERPPRRAFHL